MPLVIWNNVNVSSFSIQATGIHTGITEGRSESPPQLELLEKHMHQKTVYLPSLSYCWHLTIKYAFSDKMEMQKTDRHNSPEMHCCRSLYPYSCLFLLPSAVGRGDPEDSHCECFLPLPTQPQPWVSSLWLPSTSNTCIFLNPKSTQESDFYEVTWKAECTIFFNIF